MKVVPKILLFEGRGFISKLIKFQTRSKWTHAAILMPDGQIVESWQGAGVRVKRLKSYVGVTALGVPRASQQEWEMVIDYALDKVGAKYDYRSVAQFVTRRKESRSSKDKWFCSELVFASFQHAGINLLKRVEAANVSPGDLALSPMLTNDR